MLAKTRNLSKNITKDFFPWIASTGAIVIFLLALFFIFTPVDSGLIVYQDSDTKQVQDILKTFLESYYKLTDFIIASFGGLSFLITYQAKNGANVTKRAWALFSGGSILLAGALILCFLGRELLLNMTARNAIDFSLPALKFGRWAMYICVTLAAMLIGFFALDVALAPKKDQIQAE